LIGSSPHCRGDRHFYSGTLRVVPKPLPFTVFDPQGDSQRRREGETRGMSPSEIAMLKNLLSEQYGICDIQSNFQHFFVYLGLFPRHHRGFCACTPMTTEPIVSPQKQIPGYAPGDRCMNQCLN